MNNLTSCDRARVDTIHRDTVRVAQLFGPDANQSLVGCLCGSVYSMSSNAEACSGRGNKDNAAAPG